MVTQLIFNTAPEKTDTLGALVEFARITLAYECEKAFKRRKFQKGQKKLKCQDQMHFSSKFGCYPDKPKKKEKFKAKKKEGKKIRSPLNLSRRKRNSCSKANTEAKL